jgi:hypothetical protein
MLREAGITDDRLFIFPLAYDVTYVKSDAPLTQKERDARKKTKLKEPGNEDALEARMEADRLCGKAYYECVPALATRTAR